MKDKTVEIASTLLGKKVAGSEKYDKSLLVPIPRIENRKAYDIDEKHLPFEGYDVWNAYEFSSLTSNNVPFTRVLKIKYPCDSKNIVESKSLKLYLNSFNMTAEKKTVEESLDFCKDRIKKDLSEALKTDVQVEFVSKSSRNMSAFRSYDDLTKFTDPDVKITEFNEDPTLLSATPVVTCAYKYFFDSVRSNCRVTHQPDFAKVFIYYKSKLHIDETSLFKYLVSFRKEYHFHEECTEMIFKRLYDLLDEKDQLMVVALYTRRGGIDINPIRYTNNCDKLVLEDLNDLLDMQTLHGGSINQ